ncbi:MFS transporter [Brevibacillus laterosporus]|uniref:MFS transporter n=1 Tax=Brevibacillus laterosporus TaxID=1465 RepID=UPI000EB5233A|nr:MFS transporter [Brevibacillus laterosporus]AYK05170.1 MFS transporter [Brevibacillus laterosporus]
MSYIKQGSSAFRRTNIALFAGGLNTFAILYCTQPLLPEFTKEFQVSPTLASLSLSVTTMALAISLLFLGSLSEAWGRKPIMIVSLIGASLLAVCTAFSYQFQILLGIRILVGMVLAGLPAIAMAYLGEEIDKNSLGVAMGLYISGNSIGGMGGRIITGTLTDLFNWHVALIGIGVLSLLCTILFWIMLPPSRHFSPRKLEVKTLAKSLWSHCTDQRLLYLYGLGFLLMGSFVTLYNYIGYQLVEPPYSLSQTIVGWIFIVYLVGTFSSTWMGKMADRLGRAKMLWMSLVIMFGGIGLTLEPHLFSKIAGIAIFTFGFFGGHSIASSWVGRLATHDKAQASSLYLFFYYAGSSLGGTFGGLFWSLFGWAGVVGMIGGFIVIAFVLLMKLSHVEQSPATLRIQ